MGAISRLPAYYVNHVNSTFLSNQDVFLIRKYGKHLLVFSIMQLGTWADATRLCIMLIGKSEMLPLSVFFIVTVSSSDLSKKK